MTEKILIELASGINFINIVWAAFTHADPKGAIKLLNLTVFFVLLGSACVKAACRMSVKFTPGIDYIKVLTFTIIVILRVSAFGKSETFFLEFTTKTLFKKEEKRKNNRNISFSGKMKEIGGRLQRESVCLRFSLDISKSVCVSVCVWVFVHVCVWIYLSFFSTIPNAVSWQFRQFYCFLSPPNNKIIFFER